MNSTPLVSIIALCYNHAPYIKTCMESIFNQSYTNWELLIVDDKSTDDSALEIERVIANNPKCVFIQNKKNLGNCRSFNKAFALSKGDFIIDLATDDILHPDRLKLGVEDFQKRSKKTGFIHSNGYLFHDSIENKKKYNAEDKIIPEGDVYHEVLAKHFIFSPSMMVKREVLLELNGYDESLAYEDFDLWVRASRNWDFYYSPLFLVYKRVLPFSMSQKFTQKGNANMYRSTLKICEKAFDLNRIESENQALALRIRYEMKMALVFCCFAEVKGFFKLLKHMKMLRFDSYLLVFLASLNLDLYYLIRRFKF